MKRKIVGAVIMILLGCLNTAFATTMNWTCATDSAGWSERAGHTSVVFDNKMWVLGGFNVPSKNDVWYSTDGANWTCATDSANWSGRYLHTVVVFNGKMWVLGGTNIDDSASFFNDVWYSTDGVNWTCATDSAGWSVRYGHTSVVFDNKMWVLGGINPQTVFNNDVWYSADGVNWTQATTAAGWSERAGHTSVVFDNKIWVFAGDCVGGCNDVWYSTNGTNWTRTTADAGWSKRYGHTSIVFDNKMCVLGGRGLGIVWYNDAWYSTDGINWTQATASSGWSNRNCHTSVAFDNKIWIIGGGPDTLWYNDVWYSTGLGVNEKRKLKRGVEFKVIREKIYLFMPETRDVDIKIYDIGGRFKDAVYSSILNKGEHTFIPNIKNKGIYFAVLRSSGLKQSVKLVRF